MILVAWDQHKGTIVAGGQYSVAANFSAVIDRNTMCQLNPRTGRYQRVQVDHRTAVLPQPRVPKVGAAAIRGFTHDLALRINVIRLTACVTGNSSKVGEHSVPPNSCEKCR